MFLIHHRINHNAKCHRSQRNEQKKHSTQKQRFPSALLLVVLRVFDLVENLWAELACRLSEHTHVVIHKSLVLWWKIGDI